MNAAICYLAKSDLARQENLEKSLRLLHRHYPASYPVFIFVEPDFNPAWAARLTQTYPRVTVKTVHLFDPHVPILDKTPQGPGYRRMCHFLYAGIQEHLADFDYYLRLDSDSYILDDIPDPIAAVANAGAVYGYLIDSEDHPDACVGIGEFFRGIVDQFRIQPYFLDKLLDKGKYNQRLVYNNFEIVSLDWWRSPLNQAIAREVIASNNIFRWRWGDHILRTFHLALTCPQSSLLKIDNVDYLHWPFSRVGNQVRGVRGDWVHNNTWLTTI